MRLLHAGDTVRIKDADHLGRMDDFEMAGHTGTLVRLKESERCGSGRWAIVGDRGTCQPDGGKRACELIYCPHLVGITKAEAATR